MSIPNASELVQSKLRNYVLVSQDEDKRTTDIELDSKQGGRNYFGLAGYNNKKLPNISV